MNPIAIPGPNRQRGWYTSLIVLGYLLGLGLLLSYYLSPQPVVESDGYDHAEVMRKLQDQVSTSYLEREIGALLNQGNLEDALMLRDLAAFMRVPLTGALRQRLAEEDTPLKNAWRNTVDFGSGFVSGKADNLSGLGGAIVSDLSVVGDGRDFYLQTQNYMKGEAVDEFIYTLSIIGLGTTVATVFSGGAAAPVRFGVSVLKAAKKTNNISAPLARALSKTLHESVDLKRFKASLKQVDYTDVGKLSDEVVVLLRSAKSEKLMAVFGDLKTIAKNTSSADTVRLLKYADNTDDLKRLGRLSEDFGQNSRGVMRVLGKRALKLSQRVVKEVYQLAAGLLALAYSLISTVLAVLGWLLKGGLSYALRRLLGRWFSA